MVTVTRSWNEVHAGNVLLPALAGGLGGGLNGLLCYLGFLVDYDLDWHIVLAGVGHGAMCVLVPLVLLKVLHKYGRVLSWLGAGIAGYVAGWLSGTAVSLSLGWPTWIEALTWPLQEASSIVEIIVWPFEFLGIGGTLYYIGIMFLTRFAVRGLGLYVLVGILSGSASYVWFWDSMGWLGAAHPWLLGLTHGGAWGALVGLGTWRGMSSRGGAGVFAECSAQPADD
jgi:hypothetical protein